LGQDVKAKIGIYICMDFQGFLAQIAVFGRKLWEAVVRCWLPHKRVLTFGGCDLCATSDENRSRNTTVRVHTDRQTHAHTETNWIY